MNILNNLTIKYLKLNKKRTIVTIIGIILSGAMISAVTTLAGSFQNLLLSTEIANHGAWEAVFEDVKYENIKYIENNEKFKDTMITAEYSMAKNTYSDDEFIRIFGYSKEALENMEPKPMEGRMPETSDEIALSTSFFDGKENEPKIGDTVTFELGQRISSDGYVLISSEREVGETFETTGSKTYTVCGKINRPQFESYSDYYTAGIVLLDDEMLKNSDSINVGVITKNPRKIYEDTQKIADEFGMFTMTTYDGALSEAAKIYNIDYNTTVLMYKGVNDSQGFNAMLYSVCAILIAVIIVGSVLVIYNSFAISVSERKKQFGMLSSIGATKKQIKKSVIFEGAILGAIGIPLGILSGILGIWVTLGVVNGLLQPLLESADWNLELVISWPSILIAAVLIAATIYMSVIIPARRASKISPIDAIRQTDDIKVKPRKLKTPKFIRKIFKMPGELALKNLKRSRKRYRTTVISLIISIVLFVSVSGFIGYMFTGFTSMYTTVDYDYVVAFRGNNEYKQQQDEMIAKLMNIEQADKVVFEKRFYAKIQIPEDKLSENIKEIINDPGNLLSELYDKENGVYDINAYITTLDDKELDRYCEELRIDELKDNEFIFVNHLNLLQSYQIETKIADFKDGENATFTVHGESDQTREMQIAKVTDKYPSFLESDGLNINATIIVNENGFENIASMEENYYSTETVYIEAENVAEIEKQVLALQEEYGTLESEALNIAESMQLQKNLVLVINIFLYGFIVLISAIGIANIFNTISTNVLLRRREFANLKSIGMTDKQFKRMLNLECVFYGTKALLYGLPISILICFLINRGFGNAITFIFTLPWSSIIISILAVYIIVFATMIYSSRKVKKENIIDVIRDDNI